MGAYILKRVLLIIPTLFGIMLLAFAIVQLAPGGPMDYLMAKVSGLDVSATSNISGSSDSVMIQNNIEGNTDSRYAGIPPEVLAEWRKKFRYDDPWYIRFADMWFNYLRFDFGQMSYRDQPVIDEIISKLPVSMSLGLWAFLISYSISIPLGVAKAVRDGSKFDIWTSGVIIIGYAIPGFLFGVFLLVIFAGGSFFSVFPLRGLTSSNFADLSLFGQIKDYFWHLTLPLIAFTISSFATTTFLTKNSFLDEIKKQYVMTARAKGLNENRVLYGHVFRNAMLIVIASFPSAFLMAFLSGSLLIETIFSLDGLGLLGYNSIITRDYPVVFGTLFIFSLISLVVRLISDLMYVWIDPRIDFATREV